MPEAKEGHTVNRLQTFCRPLLFIPRQHLYPVSRQDHTMQLMKAHPFLGAPCRFCGCPAAKGAQKLVACFIHKRGAAFLCPREAITLLRCLWWREIGQGWLINSLLLGWGSVWESCSSAVQRSAVVLPCCVCHTYLLPSLSQSYVFDIKAVRKITKGTEKPVYPSDQSGKLSWWPWLAAHRRWHKASLLGEVSSAAEAELTCGGGRCWRSTGDGERHSLGDSLLLGRFGGTFSPGDAVWGWGSSDGAVVQHSPRSCGLRRDSEESSPPSGGNLNLGVICLVIWEPTQACAFSRFFCPFCCSLFWADYLPVCLWPCPGSVSNAQRCRGHPGRCIPGDAGSQRGLAQHPLHCWHGGSCVTPGHSTRCSWASPKTVRGLLFLHCYHCYQRQQLITLNKSVQILYHPLQRQKELQAGLGAVMKPG